MIVIVIFAILFLIWIIWQLLQAALNREIITEQWLKETGNYRNCQHLFHIRK